MNDSDGKPKPASHARRGQIFALAGLGQLLFFILFSGVFLFFGPLIMGAVTIWTIPLSLAAIISGLRGRHEDPKMAWTAILIGLLLVPIAFGVMLLYGAWVHEATA